MKTRHCDECTHCDMRPIGGMICEKGHKPRFYMPRDNWPYDNNWGWKRKCADYDKGTHIMDEENNQSNDRNLGLSAADELLALKLKIKDFCIEFDKTSWGWDGDCGTQYLVDSLAETVKDKYDDWTC